MTEPSPFHGLIAFPLTPADANGRVDVETLAGLVERLIVPGVSSVAVLGSTGGYAYLEPSERRRAIAAAREALAGRRPLIAGVGALRTSWAQTLARDAEQAGADALLLAPMAYTPLTEEEVERHFAAVAGATGLPLCIYNNPGTTRFSFTDALISRLSTHQQIAAVKMPLPTTGDLEEEIGRLRHACAPGFALGYSGDWGAASALLAGADAWYSVTAGLFPTQAVRLTRAAQSGDAARTAAVNSAFEALWALLRAHGGLRVMHAAAAELGLAVGGPPLPLRPVPLNAQEALAMAVDALNTLGADAG